MKLTSSDFETFCVSEYTRVQNSPLELQEVVVRRLIVDSLVDKHKNMTPRLYEMLRLIKHQKESA